MRVTNHSSRKKGSAKHNDRQFDTSKASHIGDGKNHYLNLAAEGDDTLDFETAEKRFYEKHFKAMIEETNERARKSRHLERLTDGAKLWESVRTKPEEVILQIGNVSERVEPKLLIDAFNEYMKWYHENFGKHVKVLNVAVHMDEKTPHIHMRQVWAYTKDGNRYIGQDKALEQMGFKLPDPEKKRDRHNNRKIKFTEMCKEKWQEVVLSKGLEIETEPMKLAPNQQNLDKNDYIVQKQAEEITRQGEEIAKQGEEITKQKKRISKLERERELLTDVELKEIKNSAKKTFLNENNVTLPLEEFNRLYEAARAGEGYKQSLEQLNKTLKEAKRLEAAAGQQRERIIDEARKEAVAIIDEARKDVELDDMLSFSKKSMEKDLLKKENREMKTLLSKMEQLYPHEVAVAKKQLNPGGGKKESQDIDERY